MRACKSYTDRTGDSVSSRFQKPTFIFHSLLGAFTEIIKKYLLASLCMSVCLSACISAVPTGRIFVRYDTGDFYGKSVEKLQIWLKLYNSIRYFT
jgi:hypothetical protein